MEYNFQSLMKYDFLFLLPTYVVAHISFRSIHHTKRHKRDTWVMYEIFRIFGEGIQMVLISSLKFKVLRKTLSHGN
jgi:hypothetical protein